MSTSVRSKLEAQFRRQMKIDDDIAIGCAVERIRGVRSKSWVYDSERLLRFTPDEMKAICKKNLSRGVAIELCRLLDTGPLRSQIMLIASVGGEYECRFANSCTPKILCQPNAESVRPLSSPSLLDWGRSVSRGVCLMTRPAPFIDNPLTLRLHYPVCPCLYGWRLLVVWWPFSPLAFCLWYQCI